MTVAGVTPLDRLSSGMPSLDKLLGGGFPRAGTILVIGDPTSSVAVFLRMMTWRLLNQNFECLYWSVDQNADDTRELFRSNNWNLEPFEKQNTLHFHDLFSEGASLINEPEKIGKGTFKARTLLTVGRDFSLDAKKRGHERLIILDSMTPLFAMSNRRDVFLLSQTFKYGTRFYRVLGFAGLHKGVVDEQSEDTIRQLADGIIEFSYADPEKTQEMVKAQKFSGALADSVPITIDENGMQFHLPPE
jgi:KaiC/GvpD/RAD55 family RecA-like ATPase